MRIKTFQKNRSFFCFLHNQAKGKLCFFTVQRNNAKRLAKHFRYW